MEQGFETRGSRMGLSLPVAFSRGTYMECAVSCGSLSVMLFRFCNHLLYYIL